MYPRRSPATHTEQLGDEVSVYDSARTQVHALNPTAARVWRHCDGVTSPEAIAAVLRVEMGIPEAEAVVDLTLRQLARVHLLELRVETRGDRSAPTRRWLLGRGLAAAMLPAIYSIVAPSPVDAQSLPPPAAPTLTSVSPNQGVPDTTVPVTLTGTNFVVGATTVTVNSGGVSAANVVVSSATSLTADIVITAAAVTGPHTVTVTTSHGTSGAQTFTVNPAPPPPAPTLTNISPNQGIKETQATTVAVTLTGTNFVVGATTVAVSGAGVTVNTVVVGSSTSLTANFVLDPAAAVGARTVTVTTAGGTTAALPFTVDPGSMAFAYTGGAQTFTVPPGVTTLTVTAQGAQGGDTAPAASNAGLGGSVTATLTAVAGETLSVFVGGQGAAGGSGGNAAGGFNGGAAGGPGPFAGGGGGASDIRQGGSALSNRVVIAGGGGGAGFNGGSGGAGGGATGGVGANSNFPLVVTGGGGGTQSSGGSGGTNPPSPANNGQPGTSGAGGVGGLGSAGGAAGAGGGGGFWGGGGGAGGAGNLGSASGGGGSSLDAPGVVHTPGARAGDGEVLISW